MHPRPADLGQPRKSGLSLLRGRRWSGPVAGGLVLWCGLCAAQDTAGASGSSAFQRSINVEQTLTDNYRLDRGMPESDAITRFGAGISYRPRSGPVRGFLDYNLTGVLYAHHSRENTLQNALNANLAVYLIDDRLQVNLAATISRSAISAFGVQPVAGTDANSNTTEVRTLQISPTLRGPLGSGLRYNARLSHQISSADSGSVGDSGSTSAAVQVVPTTRGRLGWSVDGAHQKSSFKQGRDSQTDRLFGTMLLAVPELDLDLNASMGVEWTDQLTVDHRRHTNRGVGVVWSPSPVTRLSAETEARYYGRSYAVLLEHRTPRAVFRYRSARSASTDGVPAIGRRGIAFDLLFAQFASVQPDPFLREQLVNRVLQQQNIDPQQLVGVGFLQSAVSEQDTHEFSAAWTGPRNAAVFSLGRTKSRRLDPISAAVDDLSRTGEVVLDSLSVSLSHRLTPMSTLNLSASMQRGGGALAAQSSNQALASLQYSTRLTPDSTLGLSLRRALYKTGLVPYDETAATATYGVRF